MFRSLLLASSVLVVGCTPGNTVGNLVRPDLPKASDAIDGDAISCRNVSDHAKPLVVDWSSEGRTQLELTMRNGVAVVAYDCKQLRLLDRCQLRGSYRFAGVTLKEEVVQLENQDELHANLPLSGAKISAGMESGATLDLALAIVGKSSSSLRSAARSELEGDCQGATHFVRAATLGAFAMANGSVGEARAAVDIFGVGAGGSSRAKQERARKDGDLKSCRSAGRDAKQAPSGCGALLRVDLSPLGDRRIEVEERKGAAPAAAIEPEDSANPCPEGMVERGAKCVIERGEKSCENGDRAACTRSCSAGVASHCMVLALQLELGRGGPKNPAAAGSIWDRACKLGEEAACVRQATQLFICPYGKPCSGDAAAARRGLEASCGRGYAGACASLAFGRMRNVYELSKRERLDNLVRACDLGDEFSCRRTAAWLLSGKDFPVDVKRAGGLLERSCFGGGKSSCHQLSKLLSEGKQAPKDLPRAMNAMLHGCELGATALCVDGAELAMKGEAGVASGLELSKRMLRRACYAKTINGKACLMLGSLVRFFGGAKDGDEARRILVRGCEGGEPEACAEAAELTAKRSRVVAEAQCDAGQPVACKLVSQWMLERGCEGGNSKSCQRLEDSAPQRWQAIKRERCRKRWRHDEKACQQLVERGVPLPAGVTLKDRDGAAAPRK